MFASRVIKATKAGLGNLNARNSMKRRIRTFQLMAAITMVVGISACVQTLPLAQRTEAQPAAAATTATTANTREERPTLQARLQAALVPVPAAAVPVSYSTAALTGEWVGTIDCGSGPVPLLLSINPIAPAGMLQAMGSLPEWKGGGVTSFIMRGDMSTNQIRMRWEKWFYKAVRFPEIDFDASYHGEPQRIAAHVINNPKCKPFELQRRTLDNMRAATPPPATIATGTAKGMSHAEFVKRLGSQKLPSLVGTTLQLDLKRGGDGGWNGYVEDPQSMVFFSCQTTAPAYKGGPLTAKISKLKSNDNGVYVTLDRCGA